MKESVRRATPQQERGTIFVIIIYSYFLFLFYKISSTIPFAFVFAFAFDETRPLWDLPGRIMVCRIMGV